MHRSERNTSYRSNLIREFFYEGRAKFYSLCHRHPFGIADGYMVEAKSTGRW